MSTTVHLVRHAAHGLLGQVLAGRMPGVPLSEAGRLQAARLADRFAGQAAAVLSSPVQRALETAAPIGASLKLPVERDAGFEEIDFGRWCGASFAELEANAAWHAWNTARGLAPTPGGETMLAAQARAVAALRAVRTRFPEQAVVVVSHADVIKAVLAYALGLPLDLIHRFDVAPASVSTLRLGDGYAVVEGLNHL